MLTKGVQGVFVGLSTIDIVYRIEEVPLPNSKSVALSQTVLVGGPATNAAITFAYLGGHSVLVSSAGCHPLTAVIKAELQQYSVDTIDLSPTFPDVPPISSVLVTGDGSRIVVSANATRIPLESGSPPHARVVGSSVLLADGHQMEACIAWAKAARRDNIKVVFDGGSWKHGTDELLAYVDYAICSADFLSPGSKHYLESAEYLRARGVQNVAFTLGPNPVFFFEPGREGTIPVRPIQPIDTMGAGDIFHGAFCFALASDIAFEQALKYSSELATLSCEYVGTRAWMAGMKPEFTF